MNVTVSLTPAIARPFTRTGKLRAAINLGSPILATTDPVTGLDN